MRKLSIIAVLALAGVAVSGSAQTPPAKIGAVFGCDAPAGNSCAFTLFHADGTQQSFGIAAGKRYTVQILPGYDQYVVTIDHAAVQAPNTCPAIVASGIFCKAGVAQAGYNN